MLGISLQNMAPKLVAPGFFSSLLALAVRILLLAWLEKFSNHDPSWCVSTHYLVFNFGVRVIWLSRLLVLRYRLALLHCDFHICFCRMRFGPLVP